jgi:hypothetical protein
VELILPSLPRPEERVSCLVAESIKRDSTLTNVPLMLLVEAAPRRSHRCSNVPGTPIHSVPFNPMEILASAKV